ncbi:MAG: RNA-binding domain-containing protein [Pyrobaculum sp.]
MKVEAVVEVRYTEDKSKVLKALENVYTPTAIREEPSESGVVLIASCEGHGCIEKLKNAIWRQGIQDAARSVISRGVVGEDTVTFSINKQAAYVGVVSFVTEPGESPLGPITFTIKTGNVRQLIDWMAPRTYRGRVYYQAPPPD